MLLSTRYTESGDVFYTESMQQWATAISAGRAGQTALVVNSAAILVNIEVRNV